MIDELLEGKRENFEIDKRYGCQDVNIIWAHNLVALLHGPVGEPRYMVALIENITQRKHTEDELLRSAAQLDALSGRLVEIQESMLKSRPPETVCGVPWCDLTMPKR